VNLRFYPSKAKVIAEKIISDELNATTYDEEESKHWALNISDKVREAITGNTSPATKAHSLVLSCLVNFNLSLSPADSLGKTRYKIVVQTTIGQHKDQGIRVVSRCLWDPNTDNYAAVDYSNVRLIPNYLSVFNQLLLNESHLNWFAGNVVLFLFDICTIH
jgi:hypothetical protein